MRYVIDFPYTLEEGRREQRANDAIISMLIPKSTGSFEELIILFIFHLRLSTLRT